MRTKRLAKEKEAAMRVQPNHTPANGERLEELLDQELKSLPDKYRAVIVLCDLEGKSLKEAAHELGCPVGTIGTRLARGRIMLARRLARQGAAVSVGALAVILSNNAASAAVPPALAVSTAKSAALIASGAVATGNLISAQVATLTDAVLKTMLLAKLKTSIVILMAITCLIGAGGSVYYTQSAKQTDSALTTRENTAKPKMPEDKSCDKWLALSSNRHPEEVQKSTFTDDRPNSNDAGGDAVASRKEPDEAIVDTKKAVARAEIQNNPAAKDGKKLPPGLAKKRPAHPGRVAWLAMHGS